MDATTLNCPGCGAAASAGATECAFCHARLATVACPSCFGLVFVGSRHCQHCGARAERTVRDARPHRCPRGCEELHHVTVGGTELLECGRCAGVWVDGATFQRLCAEGERQAALLGAGTPASGAQRQGSAAAAGGQRVRYSPCPDCGKVMNRVNFARFSGVIVDECKQHGVWFDEDELRRVVEFIRAGGVDRARAKEREALAEERRRLRAQQAVMGTGQRSPQYGNERHDSDASSTLSSFLSLLIG
jgi:Zn-finger nucleic acid-binding protein